MIVTLKPKSMKSHPLQVIKIRTTTHAEMYREVQTKDVHLVYGSPYMLAKHHEGVKLDDNIRERLGKNHVVLPQVSAETVSI